jgi:hypothetical protein
MAKFEILFEKNVFNNVSKENIDYESVMYWVIKHGNIPKLIFKDNDYYVGHMLPITIYQDMKDKNRTITFHQAELPKCDDKTNAVVRNIFSISTMANIEFLRWFIKQCKDEYTLYKNNKLGGELYYFEHVSPSALKDISDMIVKNNVVFAQRKFTTNKKFSNIFSKQKKQVEDAVKFFKDHKEWYVSAGIPYNLGFVLCGHPGSGKTSTNKAIAVELGRHVINVRFNEIKTNTQLDNLFNGNSIYIYYAETNKVEKLVLPIDKRVLIVEDFDALGDTILKRDNTIKKSTKTTTKTGNMVDNKQLDSLLDSKSNNNHNIGDLDDLIESVNPSAKVESKTESKTESKDTTAVLSKSWDEYRELQINDLAKKLKGGKKIEEDTYGNSRADEKKIEEDAITLSTLLNLLDGPCEVEGRVICVTTNYINKLDEAIIRPGRFNMVVNFDLATHDSIFDMFKHFYGDSKYGFKVEAFKGIKDKKLSPALVAQIIFRYINDPVAALNEIIERSCKKKISIY